MYDYVLVKIAKECVDLYMLACLAAGNPAEAR
jgi:hypothetical protein